MIKKIRFIKDTFYPGGKMDKKGVERLVTRRNADMLISEGNAELVEKKAEVKEEKEAEVRQTKEEKTVKRTKGRK